MFNINIKDKTKKKYKIFLPWILLALSIIVILILFFKLVYFQKNPDEVAQAEIKKMVNTISKFVVLPEDELPILATVTDKEVLKDIPFFDNASVGDKILIYEKSEKVILYSPKLKKVIDIGPFNLNDEVSKTQ